MPSAIYQRFLGKEVPHRTVIFCLFLLIATASPGWLFPITTRAQEAELKTVLILHSYHPGLTWTDDIMDGMQEGFGPELDQIHLHTEYLDTQRYHHPEYYSEILDSIIHYKFSDRHFDLVLLSDNNALNFVLKHRADLFADSPIVFCGINNFHPAMLSGFENITGIAESPAYRETIATALDLHPETRQIVVIGGRKNPTDIENRNMLTQLLEANPFAAAVRFVFWDDLAGDELAVRLEHLPENSLVLLNGSVARRSGGTLSYREAMRIIAKSSARPVYSLWEIFLGKGIVGGKLISGRQQGKLAAQTGLRLLKGEDPAAIPVAMGPTRYMFDYAQLQRFDVSPGDLPEESLLVNRPPPFYALSKKGLGVVLGLFMVLSALLFANILMRKRTQRRLQEQKERVDLLLGSAAEAIYGLDLQGKCTFCNPAVLHMLGFSNEAELVGKEIHDLIHHTRPDGSFYPAEECRVCHSYRRNERIHTDDEIFWRTDGSSFPVEYWSYPVRKEGRTVGAVVTFLDISERKEAEEKTEQAVRELNAFVYTVSHDLRAPLTAIIGFADFLQENSGQRLHEDELAILKEIHAQGQRMTVMMEDLLSLAQIGKLPAPPGKIDLNGVVREVLANLGSQLTPTGLEVRVHSLPPARIPETLLCQIFSNLIGNAVRYAGGEGGPVEVGGERGDSTVHLFVRDHGPGIAPEDRQRLFEAFYRGAAGKKTSGSGIGLATVQKIARLYGGRAWIEDTPGGGATFHVELVEA